MKTLVILLLLFSLVGCHKDSVEAQEIKATLTDYGVGFVACSGGYTVRLESGQQYLAHDWGLIDPYNDYTNVHLPATVWIRYTAPTGECSNFPGLIQITSIRAR